MPKNLLQCSYNELRWKQTAYIYFSPHPVTILLSKSAGGSELKISANLIKYGQELYNM